MVIQHLYTVIIGNKIAKENKQIFLKELVLTVYLPSELFIACLMDVYSSKFTSAHARIQ